MYDFRVSESRWLRLVDIVRRELSAFDARVEIGGQTPDDPRLVHCHFSESARIVAVFEEPPADHAALTERLRAIVDSFPGITASIVQLASTPLPPASSSMLEDELLTLCTKAGALTALVLDASSPMIWASSELVPEGLDDVQAALRLATVEAQARLAGFELFELLAADEPSAVDPGREVPDAVLRAVHGLQSGSPGLPKDIWRRFVLAARAIAASRHVRFDGTAGDAAIDMGQEAGFGWLIRPFASIYRVVLVFDHKFTELAARGALVRALPWIERLVLSLPPTDPGTAAGQVVRLRGRPKK